jgi:hypothetical protein
MKALVDDLTSELAGRYVQYLDTLLVDFWSEHRSIRVPPRVLATLEPRAAR